ncbi:beta-1,4-galactosyltransferase 3-like isoform X2 [Paramacrobiotus metropolitanus]|uniref:beta-1,4-galactosyltransferase 3-like isoform X2 n=1 Tax=Paramacrobiotus metropolitanus TaxID=2943436 RepID=UPI0024460DEB|nr:beta-1,4-galactosyltransferase 3-like isoform X2 [Paramacrobiotus metropolitanus]
MIRRFWLKCSLIIFCLSLFLMSVSFIVNGTGNFVPQFQFELFKSASAFLDTRSADKYLTTDLNVFGNHSESPLNSSVSQNDTLSSTLPWCPDMSPLLVGPIHASTDTVTEQQIVTANPRVQPGGAYQPVECRSRRRVAVIIPYRDRKEHLDIFLNNIHPFLQKQQLDYRVFLVEQSGTYSFNRGTLMNVGYVEVARDYPAYDCFIFHDVDLLPEDDRNPYWCPTIPTILASAIDRNQYRMPYPGYFGAAVSFTKQQFATINGFPNVYWGWGGEDDDTGGRVLRKFYRVNQSPVELGRYKMIKHGADKGNPKNKDRFDLLFNAVSRYKTDGLSSLNYSVLASEIRPLYTWFLVDIGKPPGAPVVTQFRHSAGGLWPV